jgi:hypothetical protein
MMCGENVVTCLSVCLFVCVYSAFVEVYWSFILLLLSYLKLRATKDRLCNMLHPFLRLFCILFYADFITLSFSLQDDINNTLCVHSVIL